MIRHIVLFKFKPGTPPEAITGLMEAAMELRGELPSILSASHGENFSDRSDGYSDVVTMTFADRSALDAFYPHPAHQQFAKGMIEPIADQLLIIDAEDHMASAQLPTDDGHERAS